MALLVPAWTFVVLRRKLDIPNAAAVASSYGSVSAVTFIAASALLSQLNIPFGGHMIAALALMDSPAIITGIALVRWLRKAPADSSQTVSWKRVLHDAVANGSVFLLCGALLIGIITGEKGSKALAPFTSDIFRGMLCLFLLDMGLVSGRQLGAIRKLGFFPVAFAVRGHGSGGEERLGADGILLLQVCHYCVELGRWKANLHRDTGGIGRVYLP
jgi:hypothetical protein